MRSGKFAKFSCLIGAISLAICFESVSELPLQFSKQLYLFFFLTFASPNFKFIFTSGFYPDSLASLLSWNGPSHVKSCLISFSYLEADDCNTWCSKWWQDRFRRKQKDRLQLHAELVSALPLHFFQTPLSFLHLKLLSCKENKPQKLKSSLVFRQRLLQF